MSRVLIVDDELSILSVMETIIRSSGYEVVTAQNGETALDLLQKQTFDLMITDINMGTMSGMELLRFAQRVNPRMAVIILTGYGTVETAVDAMKEGAFDYVTKPFKVDELQLTARRAIEYANLNAENAGLKARLASFNYFHNIVAESPGMRRVCEMIQRVAPTDTTVLILGESGSGKELVARAIHDASARRSRNFMPINCAALPEPLLESEMFGHVKGAFTGATASKEGLFEVANEGTIFLDEISSMPMGIQAKLLRVLQDGVIRKVGGTESIKISVRVLAAANDSLERLILEKRFREDLYYRLSVIPIEIPPLRDRREDILPLVSHLIRKQIGEGAEMPTLDPEAQSIIANYDWPGNVRELENAIRHALTFTRDNTITKDVLPAKIVAAVAETGRVGAGSLVAKSAEEDHRGKSLKAFLRTKEKEYLSTVISNMGGDKERAAKALKISLATLYRKLPEDTE